MKLTTGQNISLFKKVMLDIIYNTAKIERVNATFPETKTIIDGMSVSGLNMDDVQTITNLRDACRLIISKEGQELDLQYMLDINSKVAYNESLEWGVLRTGTVYVGGTSYIPEVPVKEEVEKGLQHYLGMDADARERAVRLMYWAIKNQLFWDGNKRTAILSANAYLISESAGCLFIRESLLEEWNHLFHRYYEHDELEEIVRWTLEHCIVGVS